ncbi:Hemin uptake protein hemP [Polaromonas sp. OV174]|uniref:hemin uptake protein HemP n=1 Tax=Polaromonas sp. OV174 TaxID=1855300 RepID=UPI0008E66A3D|nr:hemin uptake protein HemP [Polaromonas sp. OV174]SFC74279.1 Hemin uptake protein hemP [Polaromonas sp. OV174]
MSALSPHSATLSLPTRTADHPVVAVGSHVTSTSPGCLSSSEILRGQKTVEISHNGSTYRLQATRMGKLILTK